MADTNDLTTDQIRELLGRIESNRIWMTGEFDKVQAKLDEIIG